MRYVRIFDNLNLLSKSAAAFVYSEAMRILDRTGEIITLISGEIQLSGFYAHLQKLWKQKQLCLFDLYWLSANEVWAAPFSTQSREYRLREAFFNQIRPAEENIFSWQVLYLPPFRCAERMNTSIENFLIQTKKKPGIALLTMDEDGNVASLFPGSRLLVNEQKTVPLTRDTELYSAAIYHKEHWYMSLTPQLINQAEVIIVFITERTKQQAFRRYLAHDERISLSWINGKDVYFYLTREVAGDYIYKYTKKAE